MQWWPQCWSYRGDKCKVKKRKSTFLFTKKAMFFFVSLLPTLLIPAPGLFFTMLWHWMYWIHQRIQPVLFWYFFHLLNFLNVHMIVHPLKSNWPDFSPCNKKNPWIYISVDGKLSTELMAGGLQKVTNLEVWLLVLPLLCNA